MKKITKKVKYQLQNLIRKKKREISETNLRQKINKPNELWKTINSMCFSNLTQNLTLKLPLSPNIFTESKVPSYYDNNALSKYLNFQLLATSS